MRIWILFSLLVVGSFAPSWGQITNRSGLTSPSSTKVPLRRFPCAGTPIWEADFDDLADIPGDWLVADEDEGIPNPNLQTLAPTGGWQLTDDFNDSLSNNRLLISPSWYTDESLVSDDWLVLPQQTNLPSEVCLSWYAFSQDVGFKEAYEVWVSTAGGTVADLRNGTRIFVIDGEDNILNYQSVSLADFAGQDVYIAFHHVSNNEFLLGLDDIRLAQVVTRDLAIQAVDEIRAPINEDIVIAGSLINQGLDTLTFDSATLRVFYQVNGGEVEPFEIPREITLLPNDTITFQHDSLWVPTENTVYGLKVWVEAIAGDGNNANDTLFRLQGIGSATDIDLATQIGLRVFPTPATDWLVLNRTMNSGAWSVRILDMMGRMVHKSEWKNGRAEMRLSIGDLPDGVYLLDLINRQGAHLSQKVIFR